jgi:hypothetical protein
VRQPLGEARRTSDAKGSAARANETDLTSRLRLSD